MGAQTTTMFTTVVVLALGSVAACRKASPGGESAALASASASSVASAPHPLRPLDREVENKLYAGKCPSWVRGARTRIEDEGDGLRVTITAESEPAVLEIRSRARYLAEGKYKGGDGLGRCPVPRSSVSQVTDIERGAQLTVRATPDMTPERLRSQARARLAAIPDN
jgi:hypothetical protein